MTDSSNTLNELHEFLVPTQRLDLKTMAITNILSITGNPSGVDVLLELTIIITDIFHITCDKKNLVLAKDAILTLINLTAEESGALKIWGIAKEAKFALIDAAVSEIVDENSTLADPWTMVLSNLTRVASLSHQILDELQKNDQHINDLAKAFTQIDYNKKDGKLHYLAPIFCNLTQTVGGRELICGTKYKLLDKIIPFISYNESLIRRGGSVGILKNICFDAGYHDLLLCEKEDFLQAILYPLCGPEEFTDEENDKFPFEIQYLPESKTREEDPDLRKMLLDSLLQLCATKRFREFLRSKGVYEVLREYHKWEAKVGKDKECFLACENVVDILIKKEDEIDLDNYKEVNVPDDVAEKFVKEDEEYLKDPL